MKKLFISLVIVLSLSVNAFAQSLLSFGQVGYSLISSSGGAATVGTSFALPSNPASVLSWTISYSSAPASATILLQGSLDNSTWFTLDTSTNVNGEIRTVMTSARFIRANISAKSGGGNTTVALQTRAMPTSNASLFAGGVVTGVTNFVNTVTFQVPSVWVNGTRQYRVNNNGTNFLLETSNGGAFSTVGTFTSGGVFTAAGSVQATSIGVGVTPSGSTGIFETTAAGYIGWNTRSYLRSTGDGNVRVSNNNETNTYNITLADWGATQSAESVPVLNAGTQSVGAVVGNIQVVVIEDTSTCTVMLRGGVTAPIEISDPSNICTVVKDSASSLNFYTEGGVVVMQNLRGATRSLRSTLIGG